MFERFSEPARQVVVLAQEESLALKHNRIGTEHLLLGVLREEQGVAARVLERLGITTQRARAEVIRLVGAGDVALESGQVPFTPRAKKVLELSLREALELDCNYIGTVHILLALSRENDGPAARILLGLGADYERIRGMAAEQGDTSEQPEPRAAVPATPEPLRFEVAFGQAVSELLMRAAARSLNDGRSEMELADLLVAIANDERAASALAQMLIDEHPEAERGHRPDPPSGS